MLNSSKVEQLKHLDNLIRISSHGITQNNRILLESSVDIAFEQLGAKKFILCKNSKVLMSYPINQNQCLAEDTSFFTSLVIKNAVGMPEYKFYFYLPRFPVSQTFIFVNIATVIFMLLCIYIIFRVRKKLHEDVFIPLGDTLLSDKYLPIKELEDLRGKIQLNQTAKIKEAEAQAILETNEKIKHNFKSPLKRLKDYKKEVERRWPSALHRPLDIIINQVSAIISELSQTQYSKITRNQYSELSQGQYSEFSQNQYSEFSHGKCDVPESFDKNFENTQVTTEIVEPNTSTQLLADILEVAVSPVQMEYQKRKNIRIDLEISDEAQGLFIEILENEFHSILSNLINNSVDAIGKRVGRVSVSATLEAEQISIRVKDNGKGIPEDILGNVFNRGFSYAKINGTGYGLHHAKGFIEKWGGTIGIRSDIKNGTTVSLRLPVAKVPPWAASHLSARAGGSVIVLDDDPYVHSQWKTRFGKIKSKNNIGDKYF